MWKELQKHKEIHGPQAGEILGNECLFQGNKARPWAGQRARTIAFAVITAQVVRKVMFISGAGWLRGVKPELMW